MIYFNVTLGRCLILTTHLHIFCWFKSVVFLLSCSPNVLLFVFPSLHQPGQVVSLDMRSQVVLLCGRGGCVVLRCGPGVVLLCCVAGQVVSLDLWSCCLSICGARAHRNPPRTNRINPSRSVTDNLPQRFWAAG